MATKSRKGQRTARATKHARPERAREALSRQRIVDAALQLVEREGVEALSMRGLGAELGVDPMAVYHYFRGKDEVVSAVAAAVFARMKAPTPSAPWQVRVREDALHYRDLACAYPRLMIHLVMHPPGAVDAVLPGLELLYEALAESGLPPRGVARAADLMIDLVNGHALAAAAGRTRRGRVHYAQVLAELPPETYPSIRAVLRDLTDDDSKLDLESELDFVIAGIEAMARSKNGVPGVSASDNKARTRAARSSRG
ncbi:MAG TPA: TetR/AcrR family transcriptional regulator, partial [Terriglobales bacterium]|nr:TetR/AcrR family transcriptional regulator [Terriglobales bacterium]